MLRKIPFSVLNISRFTNHQRSITYYERVCLYRIIGANYLQEVFCVNVQIIHSAKSRSFL